MIKINKEKFITNLGKLYLHYQGIHLWNIEIPRQIKSVMNIKLFTKQLKYYILIKNIENIIFCALFFS